MRKNDMEQWIKQLPDSECERKLRTHMAELQAFASSNEGKQMVKNLGENGGNTVLDAANGLKNGDPQAVKDVVRYLQSDPNGKQLTKKIMDLLGEKL